MKKVLKWVGIVFGVLVVLFIIIAIFAPAPDKTAPSVAKVDTPKAETPKEASLPLNQDKEIIKAFYNSITEYVQDADIASSPFNTAIKSGNLVTAIGIAERLENIFKNMNTKILDIKFADMGNKDAGDLLKKARDFMATAFYVKSKAMSAFIDYTKDPSPYKLATYQKTLAESGDYITSGTAYILEAGLKVGMKVEDITGKKATKKGKKS